MKQALFILSILVVSAVVIAVHTPETRYSVQPAETEQRTIYFGEDYQRPLGGFGFKGASRGNFGSKGSTSVAQTFPYNSFIARGRDPSRISNYDPNIRGFTRKNVYIELEPITYGTILQGGLPTSTRGAARLVSEIPYNTGPPRGTVALQIRDVPPIEDNEILQVWLVDEDAGGGQGYALPIGSLRPVTYGISSLKFEIQDFLHMYDTIMVTQELANDPDLFPSDNVVLIGSIPRTRSEQPAITNQAFYLR